MKEFKQIEHKFICRRVFRGPEGVLRRSDVTEAFSMSTSKATQLIASEVEANGNVLVRDGYMVRRRTGAKPPDYACAKDLFANIDAGLIDFCHTGLRTDELPISVWQWRENTPQKEEVLDLVIEACVKRRTVLIQYTGMRRGESGQWRRIAPLGLERMGDQWRLTGQDVDKAGAVRTFVLARILDARYDTEPVPKKFVRANSQDSLRREPVELNLRLTDAQKQVIGRELKVIDGHVEMPHRCWYEFKLQFAGGERSTDIVWPPLSTKKD